MWTCVWALDATIALALERWSFPSPRSRDLFEKVTTLSHIRTRVCVCAGLHVSNTDEPGAGGSAF